MRKVDYQALYDSDLQTWFRRKDGATDKHFFVVGITDWTQGYFRSISAIHFNCQIGHEVISGSSFVTIESDKATSEMVMPIDGQVININSEVISKPNLVHEDCYGVGWLMEVELMDINQLTALQHADWYDNAIGSFFRKG